MTVPSPCIDVCQMNDATGWCEGCARNIEEITLWSRLDDVAKLRVWKLLPARHAEAQRRQFPEDHLPTGGPCST